MVHGQEVAEAKETIQKVIALPVNTPMDKRDTEVMKCIVEVISDTLSKPSPMPVSKECFETLRGDERILSILRHQNLLKELQDLVLQGAKERAQQPKKPSSFEEELSEVLEKQNDRAELKEGTEVASSKDAEEKRGDSNEVEKNGENMDGARPQASPEPGQGAEVEEDSQDPAGEEAAKTRPPASLPRQKHPSPQAKEDSEGPSRGLVDGEKALGAERGQQAKKEEEEEDAEAGEKPAPEEKGPATVLNAHPSLGHKETQRGESWSEALAVDGARKTGAELSQPPKGKGKRTRSRQEDEETARASRGPFRGEKSRKLEQEAEEQLAKEWEDVKLAKELRAEKRLEREDEEEDPDPDHSMKLSFRAQTYDFGGPGMPLPQGWSPSSPEDSAEAGPPLPVRSYPEEKKEEEGSANRRPEDQELESLSAIEAELEKVARQLQALRQG
ncbi:chromogranin-A [Pteropus vampyrus]|uniref:Chromogranin-A n=1 Tax=Pteropus vampyrus TaxID=132908 RepID=A0A6P3QWB1_PTEVA|nr:chromogranin-A [Pteropus vampyrus]